MTVKWWSSTCSKVIGRHLLLNYQRLLLLLNLHLSADGIFMITTGKSAKLTAKMWYAHCKITAANSSATCFSTTHVISTTTSTISYICTSNHKSMQQTSCSKRLDKTHADTSKGQNTQYNLVAYYHKITMCALEITWLYVTYN